MTRNNHYDFHRMHSGKAESCFLRSHAALTASTLAELLCALMIVNLIIVSILGIIII